MLRMTYTIIKIANYLYRTWEKGLFYPLKWRVRLFLAPLAMAGLLTGCSALPDKPTRATVYDFGPGAIAYLPANRMAPLPTLALDEVQSSAALDSTAVLYRLAYADAQALKPYAQARWSMTPAQLLRQRLREHLGQRRAVLNAGEGSAPLVTGANVATAATVAPGATGATGLNSIGTSASASTVASASAIAATVTSATTSATAPVLLRVELEEFSQLFESPTASTGLLRLRATAVQASPQGEKLLGQRTFIVQRPAPSADAAGGVRALAAATDAAVQEIGLWLQQFQ